MSSATEQIYRYVETSTIARRSPIFSETELLHRELLFEVNKELEQIIYLHFNSDTSSKSGKKPT